MTKRGLFLDLDWKGEGVVGLGLELGVGVGVELGLGLGTELENLEFCLERVGDGDDEVVLVKKAVIWRCWFTIGDRPLLWRRDDAIVI